MNPRASKLALKISPENVLNLEVFRTTPLKRDPFEYLIVPNFVDPSALPKINESYPDIKQPGSFPLQGLRYGPAFEAFIGELTSPAFREAFEDKFGLDLRGNPVTVTVRGHCRATDGKIHTDSRSKIITVLIYLNQSWEADGGRLRLLRSNRDLEDFVDEAPPLAGALVAFRRSDRSFHGHRPFSGPRRVIQLNWVTDDRAARSTSLRHHFSALTKRLFSGGVT